MTPSCDLALFMLSWIELTYGGGLCVTTEFLKRILSLRACDLRRFARDFEVIFPRFNKLTSPSIATGFS